MAYEQKKVIVVDGKKYAVWEELTNDHDVQTLTCAPVTFECPECGCVTAARDPFTAPKCQPAEFVHMADGTHLCIDCAEWSSETERCEDCQKVFHVKGDGHGFKNDYKEWFCDDCKTWQDGYKEEQKQDFLATVRGES